MALTPLSPDAARQRIAQGALLVDIRSPEEHASERIAGARHMPLEQLQQAGTGIGNATEVIFHCRAGRRTQLNAAHLGACVTCEAYMLEGGLDAWKLAGLPVVTHRKAPMELQRQVQIAVGVLVLTGSLLGFGVSPWFYLIPAFAGAGLLFAGLSGFCGLARLLMRAPWNRQPSR